jgi:hypothetical protein
MADETGQHPSPLATSPAYTTAHTPLVPSPAPTAAKAPVTAADKLREFEDKHFGKDAPRINGELERGVGSPWSRMTLRQKQHYESLEHLVKAEKKVADASAELETAKVKHVAAVKSSDDAAKAIVTADAAAKAEADKTPPKAA